MSAKPSYEELEARLRQFERTEQEHIRRQKALGEKMLLYESVIQDLPVLICTYVPGGEITFVNHAYCRYFHKTPEELTGSNFLSLIPPKDREAVMQNISALTPRSPTLTQEHRVISPDGEKRWQQWTDKAIFDASGKAVKYQSIGQDVTERKEIEKEIIRKKQEAERYLNLAGVIFIGLDLNGKINIANKYACEVLECDHGDMVGRNWFDHFIPQSSRSEVRQVFHQLVKGIIDPVEYFENSVVSRSGKEKIIAWRNTYIIDGKGNITSILSAGEDITEKRRLEVQLLNAQKMESIGNLAGGIAHDFNNLLFPIIGMSELLLEDLPLNSPESENAKEILRAGKRGSDLVKQILAFSRRSEYKKEPVRVQQILKEVMKLSRATLPSDIDITCDIEQDCGLVMGDSTQIHQIIMNLITNAYHSMEGSGGQIRVRLGETVLAPGGGGENSLGPGRYILLRVSDTGCGIDPDIKDKIFDPYFTTKAKGKGTGLGLSVVYGIVKTHGGNLFVETEPGRGTAISVYLPLIDQKSDSIPAEKSKGAQKGEEHILLIDDEPAIANLEKLMLERAGYTVTAHTGSLDALRAFRSDPDAFDLVITDMTMPEMTGDRLAKEIFTISPGIPVIICTGFSERLNEQEAAAIGVKGFLMKPVVKSELTGMVRRVLDMGI